MLGEHLAGDESAAGVDRAERDHALALAEQGRQHTMETHRHLRPAVGHREADVDAGAARDAVRHDEPADTEIHPGIDMLREDIARAVEIEHVVPEREDHQHGADRAGDQKGRSEGETAALLGVHSLIDFRARGLY